MHVSVCACLCHFKCIHISKYFLQFSTTRTDIQIKRKRTSSSMVSFEFLSALLVARFRLRFSTCQDSEHIFVHWFVCHLNVKSILLHHGPYIASCCFCFLLVVVFLSHSILFRTHWTRWNVKNIEFRIYATGFSCNHRINALEIHRNDTISNGCRIIFTGSSLNLTHLSPNFVHFRKNFIHFSPSFIRHSLNFIWLKSQFGYIIDFKLEKNQIVYCSASSCVVSLKKCISQNW